MNNKETCTHPIQRPSANAIYCAQCGAFLGRIDRSGLAEKKRAGVRPALLKAMGLAVAFFVSSFILHPSSFADNCPFEFSIEAGPTPAADFQTTIRTDLAEGVRMAREEAVAAARHDVEVALKVSAAAAAVALAAMLVSMARWGRMPRADVPGGPKGCKGYRGY